VSWVGMSNEKIIPCRVKGWTAKIILRKKLNQYVQSLSYRDEDYVYKFDKVTEIIEKKMSKADKQGKSDETLKQELFAVYKECIHSCKQLNSGGTLKLIPQKAKPSEAKGGLKAISDSLKVTMNVESKTITTSKVEVKAKPKSKSRSKPQPQPRLKKEVTTRYTKPSSLKSTQVEGESEISSVDSKPRKSENKSTSTKSKSKTTKSTKSLEQIMSPTVDLDEKNNIKMNRPVEGADAAIDEDDSFRVATKKIGSRTRKGKDTKKRTTDDSKSTKLTQHESNKRMKTCASIGLHKGASHQFYGQKVGATGIKRATRKHAFRASIIVNEKEQEQFQKYAISADPYVGAKTALFSKHIRELFPLWLWHTELNFNILVYGVGSKKPLLERFALECLENTDCISIDGSQSSPSDSFSSSVGYKIMKSLLDSIWTDVCGFQKIKSFDNLNIHRYVDKVVDVLINRYRTAIPLIGSFIGISSVNSDWSSESKPGLTENNGEGGSVENKTISDLKYSYASWSATSATSSLRSGIDTAFTNTNGNELRAVAGTGMGLATSKPPPSGGEHNYGRYTHNFHRLYLIIHNLDGAVLRSNDFQQCLSKLAACPCVVLVASVDHLNTPLMWDTEMQARFRWSYQHAPTYDCNEIKSSELFSAVKGKNGGSRALEYILRSLTNKHRDIMSHLAKLELNRKSRITMGGDNAGNYDSYDDDGGRPVREKGVTLNALLERCMAKLIVRNEQDLRYHLKEPVDHKILSIATPDTETGAVYISVHLPNEILETLTS
jgi:hypothetical protein